MRSHGGWVEKRRGRGLVTERSIVLAQEEDDESDGEKEVGSETYLEGRIYSIW